MADFNEAIEKLLEEEGGYIDDSTDSGGATKFGISSRAYPEIDVANLTKEKAIDIYRRDYWQNYGGINDQDIAEKLFSIAVNCGCSTSNKIVQLSANECGSDLIVDGVLGGKTLSVINSLPEGWLLAEIKLQQISHYVHIVNKNSGQIKFLKGWINRALA